MKAISIKVVFFFTFVICGVSMFIFEPSCNYDRHAGKINFSLFSPAIDNRIKFHPGFCWDLPGIIVPGLYAYSWNNA